MKCISMIYLYIHVYISRNIGGQVLRAPTGAINGAGGDFFILAAFLSRNQPGRVFYAMGPDEQLRTQQSRASGAVYLLRYDCFCGP